MFCRWKNGIFWAKKLMKIYLLIPEKFLFWYFWEWKRGSFLSYNIDRKVIFIDYWIKSSSFELFGNGKFGLCSRQKVDGKMIFTDDWKAFVLCWKVLVLNFSVMGNTAFFSAKMLMERWYLLGLFQLSMIFQDLKNMIFCKWI